jgi:hypothetical protein
MRRAFTTALLAGQAAPLAGCTSWQPVTYPAPAAANEMLGRAIRVHLTDSTTIEAQDHDFVGDSLRLGTVDGSGTMHRRTVPTNEIAAIEAAHRSTTPLAATVAGTVVAFVGWGLYYSYMADQ